MLRKGHRNDGQLASNLNEQFQRVAQAGNKSPGRRQQASPPPVFSLSLLKSEEALEPAMSIRGGYGIRQKVSCRAPSRSALGRMQ